MGLLLIAGYVVMSGIVADGLAAWTAWGVGPMLAGIAGTTGPGGGRRTERGSRVRRSGRRARMTHDRPVVVREPESGWWEAHPDPGPTATTVAVVADWESSWRTQAVVSRLAELAVDDELVVVYESELSAVPRHHVVVAGLRRRLPRHDVVVFHAGRGASAWGDGELGGIGWGGGSGHSGMERADTALLDQFLEDGSLPVVVTSPSAVHGVTAELASYLRADRVLRAQPSAIGVDLRQVWHRPPTSKAGAVS